MNEHRMPEDAGEIKPGNSLYTTAWRDTTRRLTLEQRGFAISVLLVMHCEGWNDIPDARTLSKHLKLHIRVVRRLLPSLAAIPVHTIEGQSKRIARWPSAFIEELRP